ncbi:MAG: phosphatase PAP2 family protein [Planctomycetota bacterium]
METRRQQVSDTAGPCTEQAAPPERSVSPVDGGAAADVAARAHWVPLWFGPALLLASGGVYLLEQVLGEDWLHDAIEVGLGVSGNAGVRLVLAAVASLGDGYLAAVVVAAVLVWSRSANRRQTILLAVLAASAVAPVIKALIDRTRPYGGGHSWPSGHVTTVCTLALPLVGASRRGEGTLVGASRGRDAALLAIVLAVGAARVLGLHHWPSDVVGGAGLAAVMVALLQRLPPVLPPALTSRRLGEVTLWSVFAFELWRMGQDWPGRECVLTTAVLAFVLMAMLVGPAARSLAASPAGAPR